MSPGTKLAGFQESERDFKSSRDQTPEYQQSSQEINKILSTENTGMSTFCMVLHLN